MTNLDAAAIAALATEQRLVLIMRDVQHQPPAVVLVHLVGDAGGRSDVGQRRCVEAPDVPPGRVRLRLERCRDHHPAAGQPQPERLGLGLGAA
ncbi:MAG: hypothetical protein H0V92_01555 [Pseudonocardiales bacterium]|nr:hypothetical protein [Pseudonocardiales bacterium]